MKAMFIKLQKGEKLNASCGHDDDMLYLIQDFSNNKSGYVRIYCPECYESLNPEDYRRIHITLKG